MVGNLDTELKITKPGLLTDQKRNIPGSRSGKLDGGANSVQRLGGLVLLEAF
jgi:hypothetical protein